MNKIPPKLRQEMADDPYYSRCCITGHYNGEMRDDGTQHKVEWHHNLIFAGKQVQEKECILPIIHEIHKKADIAQVRAVLDLIMLDRWGDEQFDRFSKAKDWRQRHQYLKDTLSDGVINQIIMACL